MREKLIDKIILVEFMPKESISVLSKRRVVNIPISEIILLKRVRFRIIIYTVDTNYVVWDTMRNIIRDLPVNEFVQVNTSHVVRLSKIRKVNKEEIYIDRHILFLTERGRKELQNTMKRVLDRNYRIVVKENQLA